MLESLAVVERLLRELGRPVVDLLRPGLEAESIGTQLQSHGRAVVPGLVELYGWHDGTEVIGGAILDDLHLVPGFYFACLAEATANLEAFRKNPRWRRGWLPVFANGGGDFLVVSCDADRGAVRHFRIDETEHPIEYATLEDFARTVQRALGAGVISVDGDGYLEQDEEAYAAVAGEVNPAVPWWTDPI